jgi:hypothetical protein
MLGTWAEGEEDRKKALSIWKYIGRQSHKSMGLDLPVKVITVCQMRRLLRSHLMFASLFVSRRRLIRSKCTGKRLENCP